MKIIITFLGIQAKKTTYNFEDKNYDGEVFAEALHKFCNYDSMLVCVIAREWFISVLVLKFGELMFDKNKGRKYVEGAINNAVENRKALPRPITLSPCDEKLAALPQVEELLKVWSQMAELRNDIAHVGMNLNPQPALKLKEKALSLYPQLQKLAEELLPERVITVLQYLAC